MDTGYEDPEGGGGYGGYDTGPPTPSDHDYTAYQEDGWREPVTNEPLRGSYRRSGGNDNFKGGRTSDTSIRLSCHPVSFLNIVSPLIAVVIRVRPPLKREVDGGKIYQPSLEVTDERTLTISENLAAWRGETKSEG